MHHVCTRTTVKNPASSTHLGTKERKDGSIDSHRCLHGQLRGHD